MKVLSVLGARPQFIKAASLSRVFKLIEEVHEVIVHTGQHFDTNMSEVFFKELEIPDPDYSLGINTLSHAGMTAKMMQALEEILIREKPDVVITYGDTNSTLAGAITAAKLNIPLAHIEAGLRSYNRHMPEEINRIITDRLSNFLYCPTDRAVKILEDEGFTAAETHVINAGDVMYDSALFYSRKVRPMDAGHYALCTIHREENTDEAEHLRNIVEALEVINEEVRVILPIHPRARKRLKDLNIRPSFDVIEPLGYFDMIRHAMGADIILTDSGGLQKEAYFFKKPCVTLRNETEWTELIDAGVNVLSGYKKVDILAGFEFMRNKAINFEEKFYGDGKAAEMIARDLVKGISGQINLV